MSDVPMLPAQAGMNRNRLGVLRAHLQPHRHAGSIVWPTVAGYQVVFGDSNATNRRRDPEAQAVVCGCYWDAEWMHRALTRLAERERPVLTTPPVIYLGAPSAPDDAPRMRQLDLFAEVAA